MCMCIYLLVWLCTTYDWCPQRQHEGIVSLGTDCELLCACWRLNLSMLQEQQGLLNIEPSLHP